MHHHPSPFHFLARGPSPKNMKHSAHVCVFLAPPGQSVHSRSSILHQAGMRTPLCLTTLQHDTETHVSRGRTTAYRVFTPPRPPVCSLFWVHQTPFSFFCKGSATERASLGIRGVFKRRRKKVFLNGSFAKKTACSSYVQPWLVAMGGWQ